MATNDEQVMHLFRGAPSVRAWSKYKETVLGWCLCGVHKKNRQDILATEDPEKVTCRFCQDLMKT